MGGPTAGSYLDTMTLSSETTEAAWCFQAKEPATITHLGFCVLSVSGTPPEYRISLRTLLYDGLPSPSLMAHKVFKPLSSWAGTFQWINLLTPIKVRRGEKLAMVLEHYSGYINSNNNIRIHPVLSGSHGYGRQQHFPYFLSISGSTTKSGCQLIYGMKSSSLCYGFPINNLATETINNPEEIGMRIMLSSEYGTHCKVRGVVMEGCLQTSTGNTVDMILYDSFNTILNKVTLDCDCRASAGNLGAYYLIFDDATLASLTLGKEYFIVFAPSGSNTGFGLNTFETQEVEDMTAFPGGSSFYLVTRPVDTESWTRVGNKRPQIDLVIDEWVE